MSKENDEKNLSEEKIDAYLLEDLIAESASTRIYMARHKTLKSRVTIKIYQQQVYKNPDYARRFIREARLGAGLDHLHIVRILDAGTHQAQPYFVMEYMQDNVLNYMRALKGPMGEKELLEVYLSIADALREMEKHKLIHRDIKPENILRSAEGIYKLADLGLAKPLESIQKLTGEHRSIGTIQYMSPEQALNASGVDHRADIYSLGASIYTLACRQMPFQGKTLQAVLDEQNNSQAPSLEFLQGFVSPELARIIRKSMQFQAKKRYKSAEELYADLLRLVKQGQDMRPIHHDTAVAIDHELGDLIHAGDLVRKERASKSNAYLWLVIVFLVAIAVLIAFF